MAERRKSKDVTARSIALAPTHRLLMSGSGKKRNVSKLAAKEAKVAVKEYLKDLSRKLKTRAGDLERKTITLKMVVREACSGCNGVTETDVKKGHQGDSKGYALAGVVKTVKKYCGNMNIADDAKKGLLAAAEAYCRNLGLLCGKMLDSSSDNDKGRRKTIKSRDVKQAISIASM